MSGVEELGVETTALPGAADAVIIGAGALGASTAYHLARAGRQVVVVDRRALVSQTSPRAAGLGVQMYGEEGLCRVSMRALEKLVGFEGETGQALTIHRTGSIKVARGDDDARQIRAEIQLGQALGMEIEPLEPARARALAPFLAPDAASAMWWTPGDLYLEPGDLPRAYLRAARELGATLAPYTTVTGLEANGSVHGVTTDRGTVETPVVVDAAGAWSRSLAARHGVRVPAVPVRHQLLITAARPEVDPGQPCVRVIDANVYVRPEGTGLLVGAYEPDPVLLDAFGGEPGDEFAMDDLPLDEGPLRRALQAVDELFPGLADAPLAELRGGLPTMTPDGRWIVGEAPGLSGFFVITGDNVAGLGTSPALGEALAARILGDAPAFDLAPFSLARFEAGWDGERLRDAAHHVYVTRYSDGDASAL